MSNKSIAVITANFEPFKILHEKEKNPWSATIEEINSGTYDIDGLNSIVGFIDVGISQFSMLISVDGTLILPRIQDFPNLNIALDKFNEVIGYLFLGGEYCEAIWPEDIGFGFLDQAGKSIISSGATGVSGSFHKKLKAGFLGIYECGELFHPNVVSIERIYEKIEIGKKIRDKVEKLPYEQILFGSTFFVRRQYSEALIHFWTSIERLIEITWEKVIVEPEKGQSNWKKRKETLEDNRTWTASTKLELLFQKGILTRELRTDLDEIRKARNKLAHNGKVPTEADINKALGCLFNYLSLILTDYRDHSHCDYLITMVKNNALTRNQIFGVKVETQIKEWFQKDEEGNFIFVNIE